MTTKLVSKLWILFIIISSAAGAHLGERSPEPQCICEVEAPHVCGSDGRLHASACLLDCTNVIMKTNITVVDDQFCQDIDCNCDAEIDPVCGSDGKSYKNICYLKCASRDLPSLRLYSRGKCLRRVKRYRRNLKDQELSDFATTKVEPCIVPH